MERPRRISHVFFSVSNVQIVILQMTSFCSPPPPAAPRCSARQSLSLPFYQLSSSFNKVFPSTTSRAVILTDTSQNMLHKPIVPTFLTVMKLLYLHLGSFVLHNYLCYGGLLLEILLHYNVKYIYLSQGRHTDSPVKLYVQYAQVKGEGLDVNVLQKNKICLIYFPSCL